MASRKGGRKDPSASYCAAVQPSWRILAAAGEDGEVHVVGGGVPAAVVVVGVAAAPAPAVFGEGFYNAGV